METDQNLKDYQLVLRDELRQFLASIPAVHPSKLSETLRAHFGAGKENHIPAPFVLKNICLNDLLDFVIPPEEKGELKLDISRLQFLESELARDFQSYNFEVILEADEARFYRCEFDVAIKRAFWVIFEDCFFKSISFYEAFMHEARFFSCVIEFGNFNGANWKRGCFVDGKLRNCFFNGATINDVTFRSTSITDSSFIDVQVDNTLFQEITIDVDTRFWRLETSSKHMLEIEFDSTFRQRFLNWERIKWLGGVPFFNASWIAIAFSTLVLSGIIFTNELQFLNKTNFHLPIPGQLVAFLWGSIFLFVGTFLFLTFCPTGIQNYNLGQWIWERGNHRIQYEQFKIQRLVACRFSAAFLLAGGLIITLLVFERLIAIMWHLAN